MVAKSTQAWHGGCTKSAGFEAVFPQNHQVPWLLHKAKAEGSTWRRQDQARRQASRWGTHGEIVRLASKGSKNAVDAYPADGNIHFLTKVPLRVCIFYLCCRGNVVIFLHWRLHIYSSRGGWQLNHLDCFSFPLLHSLDDLA
jgi:hypothetical protein